MSLFMCVENESSTEAIVASGSTEQVFREIPMPVRDSLRITWKDWVRILGLENYEGKGRV
jgi:hypothetical protein